MAGFSFAEKAAKSESNANVLTLKARQDGDSLVFEAMSLKDIAEACKTSKGGKSDGFMLKLNAEFEVDEGGKKFKAILLSGRGGAGGWTSIQVTPKS